MRKILKTNLLSLGLLVAASACAWGCGSDSDGNTSPAAGAAGAAGSTAGNGGTAGGTAGSGAGTGGSTAGSGGSSAGTGGQAGEAGGGNDGLVSECNKICADEKSLACAFTDAVCTHDCPGFADPGGVMYPDQYRAMIACEAANLGPSDYECSDMGPVTWPEPKGGTVCEALICMWTCNEPLFGDINTYIRCGC